MLKEHSLWYRDSNWLHHPLIFSYINEMQRSEVIDWQRVYAIQEPSSPAFFMENYTGPATPPSQVLTVPAATQSAPPTIPRDRSVQPIREIPVSRASIEPPVPMSVDSPTPISVDPPVFAEPPAPMSVEPPTPVSVEPLAPASMSKPKSKPRQKPKAGPTNNSVSTGKRKGDFIETGPKKTRIVSREILTDTSDDDTEPQPTVSKPMPQILDCVEISTKPPLLQPRADQPMPKLEQPPAQSQKPASKPRSQGGNKVKSPMAPRATPKTQERLQKQNEAIQKGTHRLADHPCETCTKRLDRHIVPCAASLNRESCFTCKMGKVTCSLLKDTPADGEVKIVQKKVKKVKKVQQPKGKQDVQMAVSGAKEEPSCDVEMREVGQSMEEVEMGPAPGTEDEMTELGTIARPDKGKGRATPAIVLQPPTPVKGLPNTQGKHAFYLVFLI